MFTQHTVTVVTAATGHPNLPRCIRSVQEQTYAHVDHLIVIDGLDRQAKVQKILSELPPPPPTQRMMTLPQPTGLDNWCGHRIYAAASFLINTEFVCFLDEDNWFELEHLKSLIGAIRAANAKWAFSLRRIVNEMGDFVTLDECENLGNLHPTFRSEKCFHVDVNCFMLRRVVAAMIAPAFYRPGGVPGQLEADTTICQILLRQFPNPATNRQHTVNYLVGNRPNSVKASFFLRGNEIMRQRYPDGMPWKTQS